MTKNYNLSVNRLRASSFPTWLIVLVIAVIFVGSAHAEPLSEGKEATTKASNAKLTSEVSIVSAVEGQTKVLPNEEINFDDYVIGPSNLLEIKVSQDPQLARTLRVDGRGDITFPMIKTVHVQGLTPKQVEALIASMLEKDYIRDPDVIVFVREYTSVKIIIQGEVQRAGIYSTTGKTTLMESISLAGGLTEKSDRSKVKLIRGKSLGGDSSQVFDLDAIKAASIQDPVLESGDTVFVDEAVPVIIEGAVMRPGVLYPKNHSTLMEVISLAGGLRELGDGTTIKIFSAGTNGVQKDVKVYNLDNIREGKAQDPQIIAGNVIVVEEAGARALAYGFGRFVQSILRFSPITIAK